MLVLVSGLDFKVTKKSGSAILKILIFWPFTARGRSKFCYFRQFSNFDRPQLATRSNILTCIVLTFYSENKFGSSWVGVLANF